MGESIDGILSEQDIKKLQNLAIQVDKIMREEIAKSTIECSLAEARIYDIKTVGVQGDKRTYKYSAELTLEEPKHQDGTIYSQDELCTFLARLSTRITNEVTDVNRVVYSIPA